MKRLPDFPQAAHALRRSLAWLCWLLAGLFPVAALAASGALVADGTTPSYAVAPHTDVLKDDGDALGLSDVLAQGDRFQPSRITDDGNEINFGYSSASYWLRFAVDMTAAPADGLLLEVGFPSLDLVELYTRQPDGSWSRQASGDLRPFAERPFPHRNFVFPLPRYEGVQTYYIRVRSEGTVSVPLRLWQATAFIAHTQKGYVLLSLYFGLMLALALYNLLLFFVLRDRSYAAYVFFVLCMAVGQASLTGLNNQFLWPRWPAWGNAVFASGFMAMGMFGIIFTRYFLETARVAPRLDLALRLFIWAAAFVTLSPLLLPYSFAASATSVLGMLFPVLAGAAGVVCYRRGQPGAGYFLLAWTLMLCGTAILALRNMALLPTNFLTLYASLIGASLDSLLLSFALADRINALRREKEQAQNLALVASQRAEQALESRVQERTLELSYANECLLASQEFERNRSKVLETLAGGAPLPQVLATIALAMEQALPGRLCSILLADESGAHLLLGAAPSLPDYYNRAVNGIEIRDGAGSCGTAAARGKSVIVENIQTDPLWAAIRDLPARAGLAACWADPIFSSRGGQVLGTFTIYQRQTGDPVASDMEVIRQHRHLATIAIEHKRLVQQMWHSANYDALTQLPNRSLFSERLGLAMQKVSEGGPPLALMFIDLDRFKQVNDTLGHDMGDLLLVEVAHRIGHCVRGGDMPDTVARISGDEFMVLLEELEPADEGEDVAERILRTLAEPFELDGTMTSISASIGIACCPGDATAQEALMRCADQAMYVAKSQGRNGYRRYSSMERAQEHIE